MVWILLVSILLCVYFFVMVGFVLVIFVFFVVNIKMGRFVISVGYDVMVLFF